MKKIIAVVCAVCMLAVGVMTVARYSQPAIAAEQPAEYIVKRGNVVESYMANGSATLELVRVNYLISGKIEEQYVREGDFVNAGDPIAKLYDVELREELEKKTLELERAQLNLQQAINNKEQGVPLAELALAESSTKKDAANIDYNLALSQAEQKVALAKDAVDRLSEKELEQQRVNAESQRNVAKLALEKIKIEAREKYDENSYSNTARLEYDISLTQAEQALSVAQENLDKVNRDIQNRKTELDKANKQLSLAKLELEKTKIDAKNLYDRQLSTVENAKADHDITLANFDAAIKSEELNIKSITKAIENLEKTLDEIVLKAPVSGVITTLPYAIGEYTSLSQPVAIIGDTSQQYLDALVEQKDIVNVSKGQRVNVKFFVYEDSFNGTVQSIDFNPTNKYGMIFYKVRIAINSGSRKIYEGMTGDATFVKSQKNNVICVPVNAIRYSVRSPYVNIIDEKGLRVPTEVTIGLSGSEMVEVTSGLSEGDKVVLEDR